MIAYVTYLDGGRLLSLPEVWRQGFTIQHSDGGPKEYKTLQFFDCKGCKREFAVKILVTGMNEDRYLRHLKKDTQSLAASGGIRPKSTWDVSAEVEETMHTLCPNCLSTAAERYVSEK
jgi:hypothetical protein